MSDNFLDGYNNPTEPLLGKVYKSRTGKRFRVLHIGRSAYDCQQRLVICQSLTDTDYPAGTIWVMTMTEFLMPGRYRQEEA